MGRRSEGGSGGREGGLEEGRSGRGRSEGKKGCLKGGGLIGARSGGREVWRRKRRKGIRK